MDGPPSMDAMDIILTNFISQTRADPALAQDLLEATNWDMDAAILAFESLQDTRAVEPPEYQYDPKDFESIIPHTLGEIPIEGEEALDFEPQGPQGGKDSGADVEENEAARRELMKKKRLKRSRGLSFADADEVVENFNKVAVTKQRVSTKEQIIIDEKFFEHSFVYPDLSSEGEELQEYIATDLLETSHKRALERSGRLNWWTSTGRLPRLEPLATSGDGNCLLHAASLYMWGFHDHFLILRTALHRLLTAGIEREGLKRRWRYQTQLRNDEAGGLTFTEEEWEFEWEEILRIATNKPRQQLITSSLRRHSSLRINYESLEEIHISVLAHTLRRPIIVISDRAIKDMSGQDLAPIYFGGIYLPLEVNPTSCYKSPVVLAYDSSHFSPLVARQEDYDQNKQQPRTKYARMSDRKEAVIPLVTPDGSLLPVQFIYDPSKRNVDEKWAKMEYEVGEFPDDIVRLLDSYLNVRWIQLNVPSSNLGSYEDRDRNFPIQVPKIRFPAARITQETQPIYQKELMEKYLQHVRMKYQEEAEARARRQAQREEEERKKRENAIVPCEGEGCDMFGRAGTNNMCSVCYQKFLITSENLEKQNSDPDSTHSPNKSPPPQYSRELHDQPNLGRTVSDEPDDHRYVHQDESRHRSPELDSESAVSGEARRALTDQTNHQSAVPLRDPPSDNPQASKEKGKKPLIPPSSLPSPSKNSAIGNVRSSKSRSPTPTSSKPLPPPSSLEAGLPTQTSKGATPTSSPVKSKGPPPISSPVKSKGAPPSPAKEAPTSEPSGKKWLSNLIPPMFKKSHAKSSSGGYTRDNILPLHLEQSQQRGGDSASAASETTTTPNKKKCKTMDCEFFGSDGTSGYCSSCHKKLKGDHTTLV